MMGRLVKTIDGWVYYSTPYSPIGKRVVFSILDVVELDNHLGATYEAEEMLIGIIKVGRKLW